VKVEVVNAAKGFDAPPQAEWLVRATGEASEALFGRQAGAMSEGGTIPFLAELASRFRQPSFSSPACSGQVPTRTGRTRCSSL